MKKHMIIFSSILLILGGFLAQASFAARDGLNSEYRAKGLCFKPGYHCIKSTGSWNKMFPDVVQRDIVQRVNRTNMNVWRGKTIAIPNDLKNITLLDVSPFPRQIDEKGNTMIIIDQDKLAWGAYSTNGDLVKWGPISSGQNYCSDIGRSCKTITGIFYMFNKKDSRCRSNVFPVGAGGARMPYCMFFYRGYAMHGSYEVPGYRASHGCIRLFKRDAEWLNRSFVELLNRDKGVKGTKVVVQKLTTLD